MLEISNDLFYVALSVSIVVFTGFMCWVLYYLAQLLKQSNELMGETREKMKMLDTIINNVTEITENVKTMVNQAKEIVDTAKDRISSLAASFSLVGDIVQRIVTNLHEKKSRSAGGGETKKRKKK